MQICDLKKGPSFSWRKIIQQNSTNTLGGWLLRYLRGSRTNNFETTREKGKQARIQASKQASKPSACFASFTSPSPSPSPPQADGATTSVREIRACRREEATSRGDLAQSRQQRQRQAASEQATRKQASYQARLPVSDASSSSL